MAEIVHFDLERIVWLCSLFSSSSLLSQERIDHVSDELVSIIVENDTVPSNKSDQISEITYFNALSISSQRQIPPL